MTIIEEMRREAADAERSGNAYSAEWMWDWADRLERSGALVPVPGGEGVPCRWCNGKGGWLRPEYESGGACIGQYSEYCARCEGTGTVRLVPIAEAQIDG